MRPEGGGGKEEEGRDVPRGINVKNHSHHSCAG